jgi:Glutathione S-transferase
MMKLYCSPTSPYARKVRIAVEELGLAPRVQIVMVDPWSDPVELREQNPLGRVPALETEDGLHLPDSRLILARLQAVARRKFAPLPGGRAWWELARRVQLADSVLDAAVAVVVETKKRPPSSATPVG